MVLYGQLVTWNLCRLGDGGTVNRTYPSQVVPADGSPLTDVVEIMAGYEHSLFLKSDGTLWATGRNQNMGSWATGPLQTW